MRFRVASIVLLLIACGDDSAGSNDGGGVSGLWAWCEDDACNTVDDGGLFFRGGRVLDASYDAEASTYCTYEDLGTYRVQGTTIVLTAPGDGGSGDEETYTLEGSFLRGGNDLKRVQATPAPEATCPN